MRTDGGKLRNLLILAVNKSNDIPAWFYLDNPNEKTITIGTPTRDERLEFVSGGNFPAFFTSESYRRGMEWYGSRGDELRAVQERFAALTEGFSFTELNGLRKLCKNEGFAMKDMCGVIDLYKYGVRENPWRSLDIEKLRGAEEYFRSAQ